MVYIAWWTYGGVHCQSDWGRNWAEEIHHRIGAPALQLGNTLFWRRHGKNHREDAPACTTDTWYLQGRPHRVEGPAMDAEWFVEGVHLAAPGARPWQRRARRLRWLAPHGVL